MLAIAIPGGVTLERIDAGVVPERKPDPLSRSASHAAEHGTIPELHASNEVLIDKPADMAAGTFDVGDGLAHVARVRC